MNDIEEGFTPVTSRPRQANGEANTNRPQVAAEPAASGSRGIVVRIVNGLELFRALRDERDVVARGEMEACAIGTLATRRQMAVEGLLPRLLEWHRAPRNTGSEMLLLSALSAVRTYAPQRMDAVLTACSTFRITGTPGPRFFADLSIPGKMMLSAIDGEDLTDIFERLVASDSSRVDVGQVVRSGRALPLNARTEEMQMSWSKRACEATSVGLAVFAEVFGGAFLGSSMGPAGFVAGAVGGAVSGFSDGIQIGDKLCAGVREMAGAPDGASGTGPFAPSGPEMVRVNGEVQVGCTTFIDPWTPWLRWPIPRVPCPIPPIHPIGIGGPWVDPVPPFLGPRFEAALSSGSAFDAIVARLGIDAPLLERFGSSAIMVHNVPSSEAPAAKS